MYVANQGGPACYYVNNSFRDKPGPGFLRLLLTGRPEWGVKAGERVMASTPNAVGARVTLYLKTGLQIREVQGGMGYASQSEYALHFGVPQPERVERISVAWPSSRVQEISGDAARALINHHVKWIEGGDPSLLEPRTENRGKALAGNVPIGQQKTLAATRETSK